MRYAREDNKREMKLETIFSSYGALSAKLKKSMPAEPPGHLLPVLHLQYYCVPVLCILVSSHVTIDTTPGCYHTHDTSRAQNCTTSSPSSNAVDGALAWLMLPLSSRT